jgi:hypothetical protein
VVSHSKERRHPKSFATLHLSFARVHVLLLTGVQTNARRQEDQTLMKLLLTFVADWQDAIRTSLRASSAQYPVSSIACITVPGTGIP